MIPPLAQWSNDMDVMARGYSQVLLEKEQVGATMASSMEYTQDKFGQDYMMGVLTHKLTAYVLTQKLAPDQARVQFDHHYIYEVPSSWFQHLKRDHMRDWVIKRWPVKYTKVHEVTRVDRTAKAERKFLYPKANIALPEDRFGVAVLHEGEWY